MKRIFSALLCALLLLSLVACGRTNPPNETDTSDKIETPSEVETPSESETPDESEQSLAALRQSIADAGALLGIAYIGSSYGDTSFDLNVLLDETGDGDAYPFLRSIPADRILRYDGWDIFCLVPVSADMALTVRTVSYETGEGILGSELYSGAGEPIILLVNVSDIMPNTRVTLTAADGSTLEYEPFLSLKDGSVFTGSSLLFDFTRYPDGSEANF